MNSRYLVKVTLINLGRVGGMLKKELGIEKPRVAIVAEKAMWIDPMIEAIKAKSFVKPTSASDFIPRISLQDVYHAIHPGWHMLCLLFSY